MKRRALSLRSRILIVLLTLLTLGLGTAGIATFAALKDYQTQRADQLLDDTGREVTRLLATQRSPDLDAVVGPSGGAGARLWQASSGQGGLPSFFQLRGQDGQIRQTVALGDSPDLPRALPAGLRPRGNQPAYDRIEIGGGGPPWADADWRFRSSRLPGGGIVVVGMVTTESDELVGRILGVEITVTLLILAAVGLLAFGGVRRELRPLAQMGQTAEAISGGELSRRVEQADSRTEVGRLGTALNAMLGHIESAFREREASERRLRQFIADASHELRTPVATVRGYAELFRRGAADRPEDLAKAMHRIESEAERMGALVDELLLLARLDQGRPLEREPVDLVELAREAVADAAAVEPDRSLRLDADAEVTVNGDAARLRQVLGNLLTNVRRHTPPGAPASVRVASAGEHAIIEVTDSGDGLSSAERDRVFERFYRGDASRSRDHGGSGLGLSIVAAVVGAHNGEVSALPTPAGGTLFRVHLPLAPTEQDLVS